MEPKEFACRLAALTSFALGICTVFDVHTGAVLAQSIGLFAVAIGAIVLASD
jgi:hypothetical protein